MKRAIEQGEARVEAMCSPSLMANNSAVRMEAVAGNLQAVARDVEGVNTAAPTEGGSGRREPSV